MFLSSLWIHDTWKELGFYNKRRTSEGSERSFSKLFSLLCLSNNLNSNHQTSFELSSEINLSLIDAGQAWGSIYVLKMDLDLYKARCSYLVGIWFGEPYNYCVFVFLTDIDDFPKEYVWSASQYLVIKTFDSIREMFTSTREIQVSQFP